MRLLDILRNYRRYLLAGLGIILLSIASLSAAEPSSAHGSQQVKEKRVRKKLKPHFAGVKRPRQHAPDYVPPPKVKKSSRVKNEWVNTKTHPKRSQAKVEEEKKRKSQEKKTLGEGNALSFSRKKEKREEPSPQDAYPSSLIE